MPWPHTHSFVHDSALDTDAALTREWLLTQGGGGFAMGTALGVNTRKYHGLLIAASRPPVGRVVVLNQLFEKLELLAGDRTHVLEFGGCLFNPDGKRVLAPDPTPTLRRFDRGLDAVWSYQWGELVFTRRLILHDGEPACTVQYDVTGLGAVCSTAKLHIYPMITLRDFHACEHRDDSRFDVAATDDGQSLAVTRGDLRALYHVPGGSASVDRGWWYGVHYPVEAHRGLDCYEDYFVPGAITADLGPRDDGHAQFTAALGKKPAKPVRQPTKRTKRLTPIRDTLAERVQPVEAGPKHRAPLHAVLAQAADDFIVQRKVGRKKLSTIIAGYPWFADWGRDTFIALPGLMLCTGRHEEARDTLAAFASAIKDGLVPNRFDDDDPTIAHYNTVDASLWFVHSALEYVEASGDDKSWKDWLADACVSIVEHYRKGTAAMSHDGRTPVPIVMDEDGLIAAGNDHSQLTWMDAAAWGPDGRFHVFTPRPGKCVEINGLWYSALARLADALPKGFKKERKRYAELAERVRESFTRVFWSDELGYLIDHVRLTDGVPVVDQALRPNQLIACALEYSPVEPAHRERAVAACRDRLLTPAGPRTLPADDPEFCSRYAGGPYERDSTYHRGIVWPWLIGPYCESVLRAGGFGDASRVQVTEAISPLLHRLTETDLPGALGQLHEIHEPLHPFAPRGCPAQAWSVAEVLRVLTLVSR